MTAATLFGVCAAALVGLGLFGLITNPQPLRKILAFNLLGSGVFLLFGVIARRGAAAGARRRSGAAGAGHHRHRRRLLGHGDGRCACCCGSSRRPAQATLAPDASAGCRRRTEIAPDGTGSGPARRDHGRRIPARAGDHAAGDGHPAVAGARRSLCRAHRRGRARQSVSPSRRPSSLPSGAAARRSSTSSAAGSRRSASRCAPTASRRR